LLYPLSYGRNAASKSQPDDYTSANSVPSHR